MILNEDIFDLNEDYDGESSVMDLNGGSNTFGQQFVQSFESNGEELNAGDGETVGVAPAKPKLGMAFNCGEEVAAFMYTYAFKTGFEWFIRSNILLEEFKAKGVKRNRAGEKDPRFHILKRLRLQCKKGGKSKVESGVTGCSALVVEGGGHQNLPFNSRDVRNAINQQRRRGRIMGDAAELENYFDRMKTSSPEFYFSIQRDGDGKLLNVFWADARCRAMCKDFGDVITYDTTFLCNRYDMPFSPFVRVNHHGSSIVLAAALISHEDADSFTWVFEQWMVCMGKAPSVILTDQDKAIANCTDRFP
ncbi:hypothetical protein RND81_11G122900 [Saponaria officinalis]|uniref:MULE transposase domain-containing protein n=1 Tax=Saponaria officinalis TaxID=3572 RepID=A0AAW1HL76_SAPOF